MALFSRVKRYVRIVNTIIKDIGVIRITTYHQQNVIAQSNITFLIAMKQVSLFPPPAQIN